MAQHVMEIVTKARKRIRILASLMPNIKGPTFQKRRLLYGVFKSTLMYGSPIWGNIVTIQKYRKKIEPSGKP